MQLKLGLDGFILNFFSKICFQSIKRLFALRNKRKSPPFINQGRADSKSLNKSKVFFLLIALDLDVKDIPSLL